MGSNTSTFKLGREITPLIKWAIWWFKQEFLFIFLIFFLQQEGAQKTFFLNNTTASVFKQMFNNRERSNLKRVFGGI